MNSNIWQQLSEEAKSQGRPFLALAPMAEVTDTVFRQVIAELGRSDVFYTEMVSCEGLVLGQNDSSYQYLKHSDVETPLIVQLFGNNPEMFRKAAQIVSRMGFSGIDINMGCPQPKVVKNGSGSQLINDPELAKEIIKAAKEGAGGLPVSVKTRIGFNKIETEKWIRALLSENPAAICVHARTKKEMFLPGIHLEEIKKVVDLAKKTGTVIIGNGDVNDREEAQKMAEKTGCDGVMIGRAALYNPAVFSQVDKKDADDIIDIEGKINLLIRHVRLFREVWGDKKNFNFIKKYIKSYINGFDGAKEMRVRLMAVNDYDQFEQVIKEIKI